MTARWVALGWAWCMGMGLAGMVVVSGWAFIDHLDPQHGPEHVLASAPEQKDALVTAMAQPAAALLEPSTSTPPAPRDGTAALSSAPPGIGTAGEALEATGPVADPSTSEIRFDVRKGDSLYTLFEQRGLSQQDLQHIVSSGSRVAEQLRSLRPGDELRLQVDDAGTVLALAHFRKEADVLNVERRPSGDYAAMWTRGPIAAPQVEILAPAPRPAGEAQETLEQGLAENAWTGRTVRVANGDSLYGIFLEEGLAVSELIDLLRSGEDAQALKRLRPGQKLEIYVDSEQSVRHLVYQLDEIESLHFFRADGGFSSERQQAELERRLASVNGEIRDSFYLAAQRAGLSDRLTMETADIFGWDIDFALDVRNGDHFSVIYEELYQPDGTASDGVILAAEFVNRDRTIRALRYEDEGGNAQYYSPEGLSMRKAFLRTPVNFTRISSRFGMRRHPILHKLRHHNGVDYAAPRGTPVLATGDGRVTFASRKGGYGKTVILKHGAAYTTLYAHLSGFAKGLRKGNVVEQGQIIGYVGSTGLATGPHLHYEFRVRDRHRDPLKVKLPEAPPIASKYKADFLDRTGELVARLEHMSRTHLASNY